MRTSLLLAVLWSAAIPIRAQVGVDGRIELTGADDADRQVTGVPAPAVPDDLLPAATLQSGTFRTALPVPAAVWSASIPLLEGPPEPGAAIVVKVPAPTGGSAQLSLNGQGPYPLRFGTGDPLPDDAFPTGTMLSLVFDGAAFQVLNGTAHVRRPCPPDMVAIGALSCIEPDERPATATFFDAALACSAQDRRLCSWTELHFACFNRIDLGINDILGNYEWSHTTSDHDNYARVVGYTGCNWAARRPASDDEIGFRCCLSR